MTTMTSMVKAQVRGPFRGPGVSMLPIPTHVTSMGPERHISAIRGVGFGVSRAYQLPSSQNPRNHLGGAKPGSRSEQALGARRVTRSTRKSPEPGSWALTCDDVSKIIYTMTTEGVPVKHTDEMSGSCDAVQPRVPVGPPPYPREMSLRGAHV